MSPYYQDPQTDGLLWTITAMLITAIIILGYLACGSGHGYIQ